MTLGALKSSVLPFQKIAGELVIERLRVPLDQREILAVVVGVAAGTFLARSRGEAVSGMQTFVSSDSRRDLRMTIEAAKFGLASGDLVATGAIRRTVQ